PCPAERVRARVVPVDAVVQAPDSARGDVHLEREAPAGGAGRPEAEGAVRPLRDAHDAGREEEHAREAGRVERARGRIAAARQQLRRRPLDRRPGARQAELGQPVGVGLPLPREPLEVVRDELLDDTRVVYRRRPLAVRVVGGEAVEEACGITGGHGRQSRSGRQRAGRVSRDGRRSAPGPRSRSRIRCLVDDDLAASEHVHAVAHAQGEVDPLLDVEERAALLAQPLQGRHDAFDRGTDVVATVGAQRRRGRRSDARGRHFAWCARAQSSRTVPRTIPRSAWRVEGWRSDRYRCPATTTTDTYMSASCRSTVPPRRKRVSRSPYQRRRPETRKSTEKAAVRIAFTFWPALKRPCGARTCPARKRRSSRSNVSISRSVAKSARRFPSAETARMAPAQETPVQKWTSFTSGRRPTAAESDGR